MTSRIIASVRPIFAIAVLGLVLCRCASAPPVPLEPPATPAPRRGPEERTLETVQVTASALNVRREPTTEAAVLTQVRRGTALGIIERGEGWSRVRLADGRTGWVASRFVARPGEVPPQRSSSRRGCPPDSDYAIVEAPPLAFSDSGPHGLIVVEANVSAEGTVTRTRVVSNSTGDQSLGAVAEREIREAKFSPPIRNCAPRTFVFTYRRTF